MNEKRREYERGEEEEKQKGEREYMHTQNK